MTPCDSHLGNHVSSRAATNSAWAKPRSISWWDENGHPDFLASDVGTPDSPISVANWNRRNWMTARIERTTLARTETIARTEAWPVAETSKAPFSLRCGALLIDYIVLAGIVAFSTVVARLIHGVERMAGGPTEIMGLLIALAVALLDFGVLTSLTGQTIGKWATGIRIVRKNGRPIGWASSLVRHFIGYPLSFLTLGLGFFLAAFNPRGRALHDIISGTLVVRDEGYRRRAPRVSSDR
jgi:uncharacterized RDD family membrane protein YckC